MSCFLVLLNMGFHCTGRWTIHKPLSQTSNKLTMASNWAPIGYQDIHSCQISFAKHVTHFMHSSHVGCRTLGHFRHIKRISLKRHVFWVDTIWLWQQDYGEIVCARPRARAFVCVCLSMCGGVGLSACVGACVRAEMFTCLCVKSSVTACDIKHPVPVWSSHLIHVIHSI